MATLAELAAVYRAAAIQLRVSLEDAKAALAGLEGLAYEEQKQKVSLIEYELKDVRALRELCERYYDKSYHPDPAYSCSELWAPRTNSKNVKW